MPANLAGAQLNSCTATGSLVFLAAVLCLVTERCVTRHRTAARETTSSPGTKSRKWRFPPIFSWKLIPVLTVSHSLASFVQEQRDPNKGIMGMMIAFNILLLIEDTTKPTAIYN